MVSASGEILEIPGGGGSGKKSKSKWDVGSKREVLCSTHTMVDHVLDRSISANASVLCVGGNR